MRDLAWIIASNKNAQEEYEQRKRDVAWKVHCAKMQEKYPERYLELEKLLEAARQL